MGPAVLTGGGDPFDDGDSGYPEVTEQDLEGVEGHEEIYLTPEQEDALDAAWDSLEFEDGAK